MATIKRFEDIEAWKLARELCNKLGVIISAGSCGELRSQLYRALDNKFITKDQFDELCTMAV